VPDSVLGERYAPYSELRNYYPSNPRGYFEVEDPATAAWHLATHAGAARLAVTPRDSVLLSLVVDSVPGGVPAAIQVNHPGLHIVAGRRYRLTLRGRAEPARTIHVAVSRAEAPWDGLGLYEATELQPGWQMLASEFVATEGSDTARVHFDIAAPAGELWLDDIVLTDLASGERVQVALVPRYRVVYRFNGLGCRGPDYAIPKPEGTIRILALGDSYMLGAGVHEQDALPARLDSLLARRSDGLRYEVINCGVSGYGTREERLFYERHARRYQPDIVLLALVFNDDLSWAEELRRGYHRERGRLASLSMAWDLVQRARQRRPPPEFDGVLAEALSLGRAARADGAELVAVAFRNHAFDLPHAGAPWRALLAGIEPGLRRGDVPFADLGPILLGGASQEALLVHPVDGHPSARAHELAAEAVLELLDRRRLLPLSAGRFSDTGDAGVARP
jgi:lysophospholipase L1-like esterase